jgi:hypothetical protein
LEVASGFDQRLEQQRTGDPADADAGADRVEDRDVQPADYAVLGG